MHLRRPSSRRPLRRTSSTPLPQLPVALLDDNEAPPIDLLFPGLPGHRVEDQESADLVAALGDAGIAFEDARQRLILDPNGFTMGRVEAVTFPPGSGPADFAAAWFGADRRTPGEIAGVPMSLIERPAGQGHPVVLWEGATFAIVFTVAQEQPERAAIDLAASTLGAIA